MKRFALGVAAALARACQTAGDGASRPAAVRTSGGDRHVPSELPLERLSDSAEPELGFQASYRGAVARELRVGFFVYSVRNTPEPLSITNALRREWENVGVAVLASNAQMGWRLALGSERIVDVPRPAGPLRGLLGEFAGEDGDGEDVRWEQPAGLRLDEVRRYYEQTLGKRKQIARLPVAWRFADATTRGGSETPQP